LTLIKKITPSATGTTIDQEKISSGWRIGKENYKTNILKLIPLTQKLDEIRIAECAQTKFSVS
jgi:hypothetical protein